MVSHIFTLRTRRVCGSLKFHPCALIALWLMTCFDVRAVSQNLTSLDTLPEPIKRYVDGIKSIHSFDVTLTIETLSFSGSTSLPPTVLNTETNREMFAYGQGTRYERSLGISDRSIQVKDWKTITGEIRKKPTSIAEPFFAALIHGGGSYLYYLNPAQYYQCFLTDMLSDGEADISLFQDTSNTNLVCFKIENHPNLKGHWLLMRLNPRHNYALAKLEMYCYSTNNQTARLAETIIDEDIRLKDGLWMPAGARFITYSSNIPCGGERLVINPKFSTFNTITSDELFSPKSLPAVNWKEDNWSFYYTPKALAAIKEADKVRQKMFSSEPPPASHPLIKWSLGALGMCMLAFFGVRFLQGRR